jgi:hypothetical protein
LTFTGTVHTGTYLPSMDPMCSKSVWSSAKFASKLCQKIDQNGPPSSRVVTWPCRPVWPLTLTNDLDLDSDDLDLWPQPMTLTQFPNTFRQWEVKNESACIWSKKPFFALFSVLAHFYSCWPRTPTLISALINSYDCCDLWPWPLTSVTLTFDPYRLLEGHALKVTHGKNGP